MQSAAAARRYSRALFAIAEESGAIDAIGGELSAMASLLDAQPALANSLFRPLHPVAQRRALLSAVCERIRSSAPVRNFNAFLIDQRRLVDFPAIHDEFGRLADDAAGRTRADVVTASPLSDAQRSRVTSALAGSTGKHVELDIRVDSSLLGGAIATVGGVVFDGSLRTQLSQLRSVLNRGQ